MADDDFLKGNVSRANFDQRSQWYGTKIKKWGDSWPYLSNKADVPATADAQAWADYFHQLGGGSPVYEAFKAGIIKFMNMPEARPEVFDTAYKRVVRDVRLQLPNRSEAKTEDRQKITQRILKEYHAALASHQDEPYNVFVPTFAPQYADMAARGGRRGFSLEDKTRAGVWVPHRWLSASFRKNDSWQQVGGEPLP